MASVGLLASGIDEINNPLNFIQGGVQALKKIIQSSKEVDHLTEIIENGVYRANKVIKSVGRFNRNNERMDEECKVSEVIDGCLVMLGDSISRKGIQIEKNYEPNPYSLVGNEGTLFQVFMNILDNSVHALAGKINGVIKIETRRTNNKLRIIIKDNGVGISTENLKKITDPFFTTKPAGEGTGLGLSISYSILQDHLGTIRYTSVEDKSTTVNIELPLQIDKASGENIA